MKNLILFPWRTVSWTEVAFAEELSPQSVSVSQSCAKDRPPFVSEHKGKMLPESLQKVSCNVSYKYYRTKTLTISYHKSCSRLSYCLVSCVEYTGFVSHHA